MRAREFITENTKPILREYKRDITLRQYGKKLLDAWYIGPDHTAVLGTPPTSTSKDIDQWLLNSIMTFIENGDPTPNNIYTPWIAREYSEGHIRRIEDLDSRVKPLLQSYHQYKNKGWFPQHAKDIMRVTVHQLSNIMVNLNIPEKQLQDRGEYEEVYKDSTVRVIHPKDEAAACYYGQGTQWCTAATRGKNYFDQYNQQGPLYILIPTNPTYTGEKYQLHFETNQFMNEEDYPVELRGLLNRFPELFGENSIFKDKLSFYVRFMPDDQLEGIFRTIIDAVLNGILEAKNSMGEGTHGEKSYEDIYNLVKPLREYTGKDIKRYTTILEYNIVDATANNMSLVVEAAINAVLKPAHYDETVFGIATSDWVTRNIWVNKKEFKGTFSNTQILGEFGDYVVINALITKLGFTPRFARRPAQY